MRVAAAAVPAAMAWAALVMAGQVAMLAMATIRLVVRVVARALAVPEAARGLPLVSPVAVAMVGPVGLEVPPVQAARVVVPVRVLQVPAAAAAGVVPAAGGMAEAVQEGKAVLTMPVAAGAAALGPLAPSIRWRAMQVDQ